MWEKLNKSQAKLHLAKKTSANLSPASTAFSNAMRNRWA